MDETREQVEKWGSERQTQSVLIESKAEEEGAGCGTWVPELGCQENKDVISKSTSNDQMGDTLECYEECKQDTFPVFLLQKTSPRDDKYNTHNVIHESSHHFVEHKQIQL